jgi:hypothetical protein
MMRKESVMAKKKSSSSIKIVGIILIVVGIGLGYYGYQQSTAILSQVSQTVTGSPTDKVMGFYIGGAVSFVVGLFLFLKK